MKKTMSMRAALVMVLSLCAGCGKADKPKPEAPEQPTKSNAKKWEPEAATSSSDVAKVGEAPEKEASTKEASSEERSGASGQGDVRDTAKANATVRNATSFQIPKQYQVEMGLKTAALSKDGDGFIRVPNSSIQDFGGKNAIFMDLGDNSFALRFIQVKRKRDAYSLVETNVLANESVVTEGSQKLKIGLMRAMSGHQGHDHGPGGHGH